MARLVRNVAELEALIGQEVGVSGWVDITQERVNTFGASTNDEQWIHTDPVRAAAESPYGGTVAHGFLTLSLLPGLLQDAVLMEDMRMGVNMAWTRYVSRHRCRSAAAYVAMCSCAASLRLLAATNWLGK